MVKIFAFLALLACVAVAFAAPEDTKQPEKLETAEGRFYGYGGYGYGYRPYGLYGGYGYRGFGFGGPYYGGYGYYG